VQLFEGIDGGMQRLLELSQLLPSAHAVEREFKVISALARTDVPVALGAAGPVGPAPEPRRADFIHARDGLGGAAGPAPGGVAAAEEPAEDLLLRIGRDRPGQVALVAIGPLSTLAGAIRRDRAWAAAVDELVVMGGSVRQGGNALIMITTIPALAFFWLVVPTVAALIVWVGVIMQ